MSAYVGSSKNLKDLKDPHAATSHQKWSFPLLVVLGHVFEPYQKWELFGSGTYTCPHADASSVPSCPSLRMAREGVSRLGGRADGAGGYKWFVRRVFHFWWYWGMFLYTTVESLRIS